MHDARGANCDVLDLTDSDSTLTRSSRSSTWGPGLNTVDLESTRIKLVEACMAEQTFCTKANDGRAFGSATADSAKQNPRPRLSARARIFSRPSPAAGPAPERFGPGGTLGRRKAGRQPEMGRDPFRSEHISGRAT